jgi:penicillin G amidase
VRAMRALALLLLLAACGDNQTVSDPFKNLPLDHAIEDKSLSAPVFVARDKYGVAHIDGETVPDVAFAQGYIMAHDRLPQMDILRRFGAGTLGELFGALDPSVIDTDLEMRVHRMKPLAQQTWDMLQASTDPTDQEIVQLLQRFADGVNAYATDLGAGKYDLDPNLLVSFDPARFAAWSPVDSLVLGRFQAFSLSWSTPFETDTTELYQDLRSF